MVAAGETPVDPLADTAPTPLSIITVSAPLTFHARVELCPGSIPVGVAVKEEIAGGATVTVAVAVVVPSLLVAVRV